MNCLDVRSLSEHYGGKTWNPGSQSTFQGGLFAGFSAVASERLVTAAGGFTGRGSAGIGTGGCWAFATNQRAGAATRAGRQGQRHRTSTRHAAASSTAPALVCLRPADGAALPAPMSTTTTRLKPPPAPPSEIRLTPFALPLPGIKNSQYHTLDIGRPSLEATGFSLLWPRSAAASPISNCTHPKYHDRVELWPRVTFILRRKRRYPPLQQALRPAVPFFFCFPSVRNVAAPPASPMRPAARRTA